MVEPLSAVGAFLSGVGSVVGGLYALRLLRRRMIRDCEERIEIYKQGIEMGRHLKEDDE